MNDIDLTFDPEMFKRGFTEILGVMGRIEEKLTDVTKSTTRMETSGAKSIGLWTALMTTGLNYLISLAHKIMGFIPEIGYSFKIAGDIIGRNLLWPLRQQLIPLLQGMLNWIRDHRAMFVRWGVTIANVFRVIWSVVTSWFRMLSRVWERVASGISKIFGGTFKTVSELLNVLLFKFVVVTTAVQMAIEPILNFLTDAFLLLIKYSKAFFSGFDIGTLAEAFESVWDSLKNLLGIGSELLKFGGVVSGVFKLLGQSISVSLVIGLEAIALALQTIVTSLRLLPEVSGLAFSKTDERKKYYEDRIDKVLEDYARAWQKSGVNVHRSLLPMAEDAGEAARDLTAPNAQNTQQDKTKKKIEKMDIKKIDPKNWYGANIEVNVHVGPYSDVNKINETISRGLAAALQQEFLTMSLDVRGTS